MKKLFAALLALVILAMPILAVDAGGNLGKVPSTLDEIKVDGKMDKIYEQGLKITIDQAGKEKQSSTGTAYLVSSDGYLYVFVDVKGNTWTPEVTADMVAKTPWSLDNVELIIDYANAGVKDKNVTQYRIGLGSGELSVQNGDASVKAYGNDAVKAAKVFEGAMNDSDVEFKVPCTSEKIGINIMISDVVSATETNQNNIYVYSEVTKSFPGAWKPEQYPTITLDGEEVTAIVVEEKAPTAAATFDGIAVLAVVAALSGAGVVVSKRK